MMKDDEAAITAGLAPARPAGLDRRRRRREETVNEILGTAVQVMTEEGVAGLSLSEVARRMGIQPPSLYKYFPSKVALYDALFLRGAQETLDAFSAAAAEAEPGWNALVAGTEAVIRLGLDHQVVAELLNWRPVPGFEPSPQAFAPSVEFVHKIAQQLEIAAARGELDPAAASEEGLALLSVLIAGVFSQQLANEPHATFQQGRYTRLTSRVLELFRSAYPLKEGEQ
jgi:AcrR family transcriptional regulator